MKKYAALGVILAPLPPLKRGPINPVERRTCLCERCKKCRHREYVRQWRANKRRALGESLSVQQEMEKLCAVYAVYREEVLRP